MSIIHCYSCSQYIDTDYHPEHEQLCLQDNLESLQDQMLIMEYTHGVLTVTPSVLIGATNTFYTLLSKLREDLQQYYNKQEYS